MTSARSHSIKSESSRKDKSIFLKPAIVYEPLIEIPGELIAEILKFRYVSSETLFFSTTKITNCFLFSGCPSNYRKELLYKI